MINIKLILLDETSGLLKTLLNDVKTLQKDAKSLGKNQVLQFKQFCKKIFLDSNFFFQFQRRNFIFSSYGVNCRYRFF